MLLADLSECLAAAVMAGCMAMTEAGRENWVVHGIENIADINASALDKFPFFFRRATAVRCIFHGLWGRTYINGAVHRTRPQFSNLHAHTVRIVPCSKL